MNIRKATLNDLDGINYVRKYDERHSLNEISNLNFESYLCDSEKSYCCIAEDEGMIIGYIYFHEHINTIVHNAVVLEVFVLGKYRYRGSGTMLIEYAIREAKLRGTIDCIALGVMGDNVGAINLYTRLGFVRYTGDLGPHSYKYQVL